MIHEEHLCFSCHDGQTASTDMASLFARPSSHPVDDAAHTTWTLECTHCHNPHANTQLQPYIADPDPDDGYVPVGLDENYCLTCHDGQQASDRTMFTDSAHFQNTQTVALVECCKCLLNHLPYQMIHCAGCGCFGVEPFSQARLVISKEQGQGILLAP